MTDEKLPGEEKTIDTRVTADESAPKAGLEREDAQPDPELVSAAPAPVPTRRGMWSEGTGDTSGYSRIVREVARPVPATPPLGSWYDGVRNRLASLVENPYLKVTLEHDELTFYVPREKLTAVMQALRDDAQLRFEFCASVSGVHYPDDGGAELHAVYHLASMTHNRRLRVETTCPDTDPHVPSVVATYPAADWHERETWDMFGIIFDGHPHLTRILMPDDWVGHPQRKDYPLGGIPIEYKGTTVPPVDQRRSY
ncbi:MAG: NADH-quinone oxidoreductase subunit C [Propionicimonas sp.]|uniref:NADH-quinone oxidoreductase subunit C n=1 Tax=Propionicimonas sp. TaxID=1955623 RepID=UPI002B20BF4B|nr:NADH-quinone oxidoreductase subunit C [Propionicimonas sp.]MEA4943755.1 NADH-quinone oxidoreductase subunit C [Propionicimonas sp.]